MNRLDIPETTPASAGLYRTYRLNAKVSDDELLTMLFAENRQAQIKFDAECKRLEAEAWSLFFQQSQQLHREFIHTGRWPDHLEQVCLNDRDLRLSQVKEQALFDCWEMIFAGQLGRHLITEGPHAWNLVTSAYLIDTEGARLCNAHTSNEDGIIKYLAVGTGNSDPTSSDTQLLRETFRNTPLTSKNTSSGSKLVLKLDFTEANITTSTLVDAGTHDLYAFDVDSTTGFAVGDAIEVGTSPSKSYGRISAITPGTPGTITVEPTEPLLYVPTEGQTVKLMIGEFGAFGNVLATSTPNSGSIFSRSANNQTRILKNSDLAWFIKYQYIRTAI